MKTWNLVLCVAATLWLSTQAAAQNEDPARVADEEEWAEEAARAAEEAGRLAGEAKEREKAVRKVEVEVREAEVERRMAEAEQRLAEAARQIAELSTQRLRVRAPGVIDVDLMTRPRLGVTIGGSDDAGPVEGVSIIGVTPGTSASEVGMRAGDVITSINGESLSAGTAREANEKLLDFMDGVEEGDTLDVEYLRDGNVQTVQIEPRAMDPMAFAFGDGGNFTLAVPGAPLAPAAPGAPAVRAFTWSSPWIGNAWADMELVELSERLGSYFGTDSGLLVVSAPTSDALKLEDGDVIQSIDGREPTSVGHALRILGSYQPGESLELRIMRDRKRQTLTIEMPDDRTSLIPAPAPAAQVVPRAPLAPRPARP